MTTQQNQNHFMTTLYVGNNPVQVNVLELTCTGIKQLAGITIPTEYDLYLEVNGPDDATLIPDDDTVTLANDMRFFVKHKVDTHVEIYVDLTPIQAPKHIMFGHEILSLVNRSTGYDLYLIPNGREIEFIDGTKHLYLVPGEQFMTKEHEAKMVNITVNNVQVPIQAGTQTGSNIKKAAMAVANTNVSTADILCLLPSYKEIGDYEAIIIQGGESFKTSTPEGSSS